MVETPAWVEDIYGQNWPTDHLNTDPDTWLNWHNDAARGRPPAITTIVREQYDKLSPWYIREALWTPLSDLANWNGKKRIAREMSRGVGKTWSQALLYLWLGEYVVPYVEKLPGGMDIQPDNRRLNVIGRSAQFVGYENLDKIHTLLAHNAPWLKLPGQDKYWDSPGSVKERQIRKRKFNDKRLDLASGVSIRGYGWDQSTRGSHPLMASIDDLVTEENWHRGEDQYSTTQGDIVPSVVPGGAIVVMGTPQAPGDYYDIIKDSGSWDYKTYPAYDPDGSLGYKEKNKKETERGVLPEQAIRCEEDWHCLNPLFLGYEQLQAARGNSRRDEVAYLREYMLERVVETLQLVNPHDFDQCLNQDRAPVHRVGGDHPHPIYCGIDPSMLKQSDMAFVVLDKLPSGERRILHIERINAGEDIDPVQLIEVINQLHYRYHPKLLIEGNSFQAFIEPFMQRLTPAIDIDHLNVSNIKHTSAGWPLIGKYFAAHMLDVPYNLREYEQEALQHGDIKQEETVAYKLVHGPVEDPDTHGLRDQLSNVMKSEGKVVTNDQVNDDLVSALYLALKASQEQDKPPQEVQGTDIKSIWDDEENKLKDNPEQQQIQTATIGGGTTDYSASPSERLQKARRLDRR
jgi:hypothetical protein